MSEAQKQYKLKYRQDPVSSEKEKKYQAEYRKKPEVIIKKKEYKKVHREVANQYYSEYYKNPEKKERMLQQMASYRNRKIYNISDEEVRYNFLLQRGACAICLEKTKLVVDHCHKTGVFRGLLCGRCNRGIGLLRDNTQDLKRAIKYLIKK
jgi:hypothetical protein